MGKIFGISDLPVSTIMTALEETRVPEPIVRETKILTQTLLRSPKNDIVVSKQFENSSNPVVKLRNGFGKLMKHFSKANPNK